MDEISIVEEGRNTPNFVLHAVILIEQI